MHKPSIYLNQWQAAELFCRLITKFEAAEGRKIEDFQDNDFLMDKLEYYGKSYQKRNEPLIPSYQLSLEIFGRGENHNGSPYPNRPKEIYELSRMIRYSEPVVLGKDDVWRHMLKYIGDEQYTKSVRFKKLRVWEPSDKQRRWEGQSWWMYFYDKDAEGQNGVTRAVLNFGTFAKAEIVGYRTDTGLQEGYEGFFKIHSTHLGKNAKDGDGDTITLRMKLKASGEKDLHIRIYIGIGVVTLALGQFNNSGSQSFYNGTVMIEKIPDSIPVKGRVSEFFVLDENGKNSKLPEHVCKFFRLRVQNIQRVPKVVKSKNDFKIWHDRKNPHLKQETLPKKSPVKPVQKNAPIKKAFKKTSTRKRGKP